MPALIRRAAKLLVTVALAGSVLPASAQEARERAAAHESSAPLILPPELPRVELAPDLRAVVVPPPDVPDVPAPEAPAMRAAPPAASEAASASKAAPASVASALEALLQNPEPILKKLAKLSRAELDGLRSVYATRVHEPIWLTDAAFTARAQAVLDQLGQARGDALDPGDYPTLAPGLRASAEALAEADLALSAAAFAYARDARGGRIEPSRLSKLITPELELPSPTEVLATLAAAPDAGQALADYNPRHEGYRALRRKLAELRLATASLEPAAAPAARSRKGKTTPEPRAAGAADIIANMERWRWLPRDLGSNHIIVNLPEYRLRVVRDGAVIHDARVIVGKPETPTPVFSHPMEYVIVNPSWYIPPSILKNEILPGLAADPAYAAKRGYEVIRRNGVVSVRQPPGERNALGFIKFMLPNKHAVYLHDTPSRALFGSDARAFSHGCVRVDQPFRLAEFVLGDQGYSEERLRKMIGRGERQVRLTRPIPVHLAYFTLEVDGAGRLVRRADIYGHDKRVLVALGLDGSGPRFAQTR